MILHRRHFLAAGAASFAGAAMSSLRAAHDGGAARSPRILLRPGTFQIGNIGDIAHSPGALRLFERLWPEAELTLWPRGISPEARESLVKSFPRLRIVEGDLDAKGQPATSALAAAWAQADLLLHGSAPGFKGGAYLPAWRAASRKPYGLFGITHDPISGIAGSKPEGDTLKGLRAAVDQLPAGHLQAGTLALLNGAAFIFCRDSLSAHYFKQQGVRSLARAAAVISFECHSPIIALANGTPAFYVRQPTDTIKGQMYHDIGASDWTFEVEETNSKNSGRVSSPSTPIPRMRGRA